MSYNLLLKFWLFYTKLFTCNGHLLESIFSINDLWHPKVFKS
uniref:Uncharacterized protein n=1 Tax=Tetranychus urticae TaxID=32264 RepID=T1K9N9_TETUR